MAGDAETGVTVIRLVKELDAGPILAQEAFVIEPEDHAGAVYAKAAPIAADLLDTVLADPDPAFRPQPSDGVTYAEKITAADRLLDLERPAPELVDIVRALSPHIGARAELHGRPLTVWRARVAEDGSYEPLEVQPDGGSPMSYEAWLRGLRP
jgi:methionyl-tRNA formyltransferase